MLSSIWKRLQLLRLAAVSSKIARTRVQVFKTSCSHLLFSEHRCKLLTGHSSDDTKLLRFTKLRWAEIVTKQASVKTTHVLLYHFYKNKASSHKEMHLNWCFFCHFNLLSIFSAFVVLCLSSKHSLGWEFVYFATRFVGISQNLSLSYSFYTTVVTNSLYEPHLLLKNISFPLRLSESQGMQKFKSQLNVINTCVINPCSVSEKDTLFQPIRARVI